MANWQRHLRLQPEWGQAQEHEISVQELAKVLGGRLKALRPFEAGAVEDEREELYEWFLEAAEDETLTTRDFDQIMQALYEWGDTPLDGGWNGKKVCWIDTMTARNEQMPAEPTYRERCGG